MAEVSDFPSNSNRNREVPKRQKQKQEKQERETPEKVISGEVVQRKRPMGQKLKDVFFGGEFKTASQYVLVEVLLPAFQNMVVDATSKGIERVIYGEVTARRPSSHPNARVRYDSNPINRGSSQRRHPNLPDQPARPVRSSISDVIFSTREDAETVLERMQDILDSYETVSVADLHGLTGLPTLYTDNDWGWFDIRYATLKQTRNGYILELPAPEVL